MPTPQQTSTVQVSKLIANAKAILTNHVGISLGVRNMNKLVSSLLPNDKELIDFSVFQEFEKKIDGCPVGSERLLWDKESLKKKDIIVDKVIRIYRDKIIDKCFEIISLEKK
jgi:hypothetical protein